MNSLFENRNSWMSEVKDMPKPLHMVCPNCDNNWLGYVVHQATCPTPEWRFDSRTDPRLV